MLCTGIATAASGMEPPASCFGSSGWCDAHCGDVAAAWLVTRGSCVQDGQDLCCEYQGPVVATDRLALHAVGWSQCNCMWWHLACAGGHTVLSCAQRSQLNSAGQQRHLCFVFGKSFGMLLQCCCCCCRCLWRLQAACAHGTGAARFTVSGRSVSGLTRGCSRTLLLKRLNPSRSLALGGFARERAYKGPGCAEDRSSFYYYCRLNSACRLSTRFGPAVVKMPSASKLEKKEAVRALPCPATLFTRMGFGSETSCVWTCSITSACATT